MTDGGEQRRIVGQTQIQTKPEQCCVTHGTTGSQDVRHFPSTIIEDRLQVRFHHPGMCESPQEPKGKGVSNQVTHQSSPIDWLEAVGMVPEAIRALRLHVHKLDRRIPGLNLGQPQQREPVPAQPVEDTGSRSQVDRLGARESGSPSQEGVILSRLLTSAKNAKTSSIGRGIVCSRCSMKLVKVGSLTPFQVQAGFFCQEETRADSVGAGRGWSLPSK